MQRNRTRLLPVVAALGVALLAAGCNDSGSKSGATPTLSPVSPGLLDGTVTLAADQPLSSAEQQVIQTVLKARLDSLNIDAVVTMVGDRTVRLQVPAPTVNIVRQLGAPGRFEIRPVETLGPKGQSPRTPPGALPPPIAASAGRCAIAAPGDSQGWTVACDAAQTESYLLWPTDLSNAEVRSAQEVANVSQQSTGQWFVNVSFTAAGQSKFYQLTQRSLGLQVALVVDGVVRSAPVIESAINGDAQITATMNESQAQLLAALIGNGALPVALHPAAAASG